MKDKLLDGYERFKQGYLAENRDRIHTMAETHTPSCILITCCDARLEPSLIFDTEPGELFVIRNVANLVPPCEDEEKPGFHGTSAALQFAVTALEVPEIIVLGHSRCGGIRSLVLNRGELQPGSFISQWMSIVAPVADLAADGDLDDPETFHRCEKAAIGYSLENLMSYPWITERVRDGRLKIRGWHYNIYDGELEQVSQ